MPPPLVMMPVAPATLTSPPISAPAALVTVAAPPMPVYALVVSSWRRPTLLRLVLFEVDDTTECRVSAMTDPSIIPALLTVAVLSPSASTLPPDRKSDVYGTEGVVV